MPAAMTISAIRPVITVSRSRTASLKLHQYGQAVTMSGNNFGASRLLYGDVDDRGDDLSSAKGLIFGSAFGLVLWLPVVAYFFG